MDNDYFENQRKIAILRLSLFSRKGYNKARELKSSIGSPKISERGHNKTARIPHERVNSFPGGFSIQPQTAEASIGVYGCERQEARSVSSKPQETTRHLGSERPKFTLSEPTCGAGGFHSPLSETDQKAGGFHLKPQNRTDSKGEQVEPTSFPSGFSFQPLVENKSSLHPPTKRLLKGNNSLHEFYKSLGVDFSNG